MSAEALLGKLDCVRGKNPWRARCPACGGNNASKLSIREESDGRVLVHCFSGCGGAEVLSAVGLDFDVLFPPRPDDRERNQRVKRPWSAREVAQAFEREAMVAWVLLRDIGGGKVVTASDRARANLCAERCAALLGEMAHAS